MTQLENGASWAKSNGPGPWHLCATNGAIATFCGRVRFTRNPRPGYEFEASNVCRPCAEVYGLCLLTSQSFPNGGQMAVRTRRPVTR